MGLVFFQWKSLQQEAAATDGDEEIFPGALKPFPKHWGDPPLTQTKDSVNWPDGYGQGSGTMRNWIGENLSRDACGLPRRGGENQLPPLSSSSSSSSSSSPPLSLPVVAPIMAPAAQQVVSTTGNDGVTHSENRGCASLGDQHRLSSPFVSPRSLGSITATHGTGRRMSMKNGQLEEQELDSDDEAEAELDGVEVVEKNQDEVEETGATFPTFYERSTARLSLVPDGVNIF